MDSSIDLVALRAADSLTSLDPEETSPERPLQTCYRSHLRKRNPQEFDLTDQLYRRIAAQGDRSKLIRLRKCRTNSWYVRCEETGEVRIRGNACRERWCVACSTSKAYAVAMNTAEWLKTAEKPRLVTLTLRSSAAPLATQLDHLLEHFRKLRSRAIWKRNVAGGIWFLQVTYNQALDQWHPHVHCVVDASYMPQRELSAAWLAVTRTSKIVDIRTIRTISFAVRYVTRYVARPAKLAETPEDHHLELYDAFLDRRMAGTFGTARTQRLLTPTEPPKGTWTRVAPFRWVQERRESDPGCQALYQAWITSTPLIDPPKVEYNHWTIFGDPPEVDTDPPVILRQLDLRGVL